MANYFTWNAEDLNYFAEYSVEQSGELKFWSEFSTESPHQGTKSMKITVLSTQENSSGMLPGNWNAYPWNFCGSAGIYYRFWMKIMPGFNWGTGARKVKASRCLGGDVACGYTGYLWADGFNIAECVNDAACPGEGCVDADGTSGASDSRIKITYDLESMDDGAWHEYIIYVKPNTDGDCTGPPGSCDAIFRVYVDGQQIGEITGWKLQGIEVNQMNEGWGGWMVQPFWQLTDGGGNGGVVYIDHVSTDSTWNSTEFSEPGGGGSAIAPTVLPRSVYTLP